LPRRDGRLTDFLAVFFTGRFLAVAFFFAAFFTGFGAADFLVAFFLVAFFAVRFLVAFFLVAFFAVRFLAAGFFAAFFGAGFLGDFLGAVETAGLTTGGRSSIGVSSGSISSSAGGGGTGGGGGGGEDGIGSIQPEPDQPISVSSNAAIWGSLGSVLRLGTSARLPGALYLAQDLNPCKHMRALLLTELGGIDRINPGELPDPPHPGSDQVLIEVRAAALNHLDLFVLDGLPGIKLEFPHVVGTDAAGVVRAVGDRVTGLRSGDRVVVNPGISCGSCDPCRSGQDPLCRSFGVLGEHHPGTAAELLLVPARNVVKLSADLTWAEAAAFPLATLTAWRMLTTRARVQPGEAVLIWGIGGGVALAALGVAKHLGATVIVTSSSDAKLEKARALGADLTLNHATADVAREVRAFTKVGAHVVVDSVGERTWERSLKALRPGGRLVTCGATTGPHVSLDIRRLFWFQWSLLGSTMSSVPEFTEMMEVVNAGGLRPVVDSVVPLDEGRQAYQRLASGEHFGKVVIEISGG